MNTGGPRNSRTFYLRIRLFAVLLIIKTNLAKTVFLINLKISVIRDKLLQQKYHLTALFEQSLKKF
jgi:hypothetical protein